MFTFNVWSFIMGIMTAAALAKLTKAGTISQEEHDKILAEVEKDVADKVTEATTPLNDRITSLEGDVKSVNDALVDPTLTAEETTAKIGEVLNTEPVNAPAPEEGAGS